MERANYNWANYEDYVKSHDQDDQEMEYRPRYDANPDDDYDDDNEEEEDYSEGFQEQVEESRLSSRRTTPRMTTTMTTRRRTTQRVSKSRLNTRRTTPRMTATSPISMASSDGGARRAAAKGGDLCRRTRERSWHRCSCGWQTSKPGPRLAQERRGNPGA